MTSAVASSHRQAHFLPCRCSHRPLFSTSIYPLLLLRPIYHMPATTASASAASPDHYFLGQPLPPSAPLLLLLARDLPEEEISVSSFFRVLHLVGADLTSRSLSSTVVDSISSCCWLLRRWLLPPTPITEAPSSAPAILNRGRGALPCQTTVIPPSSSPDLLSCSSRHCFLSLPYPSEPRPWLPGRIFFLCCGPTKDSCAISSQSWPLKQSICCSIFPPRAHPQSSTAPQLHTVGNQSLLPLPTASPAAPLLVHSSPAAIPYIDRWNLHLNACGSGRSLPLSSSFANATVGVVAADSTSVLRGGLLPPDLLLLLHP
ncbi:hypothetical protein BHE74_00046076 [Ensete ventricosum]|nr:hypothetical protein BHE74_00046076 [Ensete ventricosum]